MIGVQNEKSLQRTRHDGVHLVGLCHGAEVQAQEIIDEAEAVVGVEERLADALLVGICGHDGHLRQQAHRRDLDVLGIRGVERVLVVRREGGDPAREHRHGMCLVRQPVEELLQVFVQQGVAPDAVVEVLEFARARNLAVDEQPGDLEERQPLRHLLDGVTAIPQDSLVAIDVRDVRLRRRGVHEAVVEGGHPRLLGERREVDRGCPVDARENREFGRSARKGECRLLRR